MAITPENESIHTPAEDAERKAMDEAATGARDHFHSKGRAARTALIVAAVSVAAFLIGRQTGPGKAPASPTTRVEHSQGDGHDHAALSGEKQLWTCSMHPQVIQPEPGMCPICHMELTPLKADGAAGGGTISIDPVVVQNMGVRTADVVRGPIVQTVRVVGYLQEPEPLHRDINLRVNGWIEKLYANIDGMDISKGQPLFDLYSPELTVAVDEMIAARKHAERASDDPTTRNMLDTARRKLAQMGLTPDQIDELSRSEAAPATVPILSPVDGHLTSKMVYEGAAVKSGDLVMRLASRHQMWVEAQVPEQQMALISNGQPTRVSLVSQPGKVYSGKVLFVHPHVDPQTRTALVRVEIDNQDLALREGMYATVEILADAYREAPLVPREAVIETGRRHVVFVALDEGRFAPREVTLGLPGKDATVEIVAGLKPGDEVVTSGQFLLDSESRMKEAVAKHLSGGLPGHAGHTPTAGAASGGADHPAIPASQPVVVRVDVPHADDMLKAYLAIAEALGARQEADTPLDVSPLVNAAGMASQHAHGEAQALAGKVADAAKAMVDKPIAQQRESFVAVSTAIVELAKHAKLSKNVAPTLYVMHCPMAFEDKGANWLQDEDTIANPYYATQMKKCGEVVEKIELAQ